jgi:hypothetical protein
MNMWRDYWGILRTSALSIVILFVIGACGNYARGQAVTFTLSINDNGFGIYTPGDFAVYATDSTADGNRGIQSYSAPVAGAVTINNATPYLVYSTRLLIPPLFPGGELTLGFTDARSQTSATVGTGDIVNGFGQSSGDLSTVFFVLPLVETITGIGAESTSTAYSAPLLLETGTFSSTIPNWGSGTGFADVFNPTSNSSTTLLTPGSGLSENTQTLANVPEPISTSVLFLMSIVTLSRRRKCGAKRA